MTIRMWREPPFAAVTVDGATYAPNADGEVEAAPEHFDALKAAGFHHVLVGADGATIHDHTGEPIWHPEEG